MSGQDIVVNWAQLNRVVAELSAQISALNERLEGYERHRHYFKAGDGLPRSTNPPHDVGEVAVEQDTY